MTARSKPARRYPCSTDVTWAMRGDVPFLAKIVHVFFNVDKTVGRDFAAGLAALKAIAER